MGPRAPGVRVLRDFELDERSSSVVSIWADRVDLWFVADDRDCVLTLRLAVLSGRASGS